MRAVQLIRPVRGDDERARRPQLPREVGDQLERRLVRPVEVVDREDERLRPRGRGERIGETSVRTISLQLRDRLGPGPADAHDLRQCHARGSESVDHRTERTACLDLAAFAKEHTRAAFASATEELAQQCALPKPGVGADERGTSAPTDRGVQQLDEPPDLDITSDEGRAEDPPVRRSGRLDRDRKRFRERSPVLSLLPVDAEDRGRSLDPLEYCLVARHREAVLGEQRTHDLAD